ncbi:remodeling complex ATPase chain [Seminavis robusta]|uniref:Remodeling complex ATPase chain n=1 Tax=Seminavis robusta TaxID=568900 RepID=A0A9N8EVE2_9STRA|nr:remodeling complex ATPase chain [Seminavis robusta]|eukprot:Sro1796_g298100.1 remodeling complex ATPase chain (261) ;mRNA; f:7806-8588
MPRAAPQAVAEQHNSLEKDDLMKMVRFGADQILSGKGGTYTDEDIDALISRGEERTEAMQAKLQTDAKHNLANFSLIADDDNGTDTFAFDGKNYRGADKGKGNFINQPQRQRKRNYDVNEYFRGTMNTGTTSGLKAHAADAAAKKRKKGSSFQDFQLFDSARIEKFNELERELATKKEAQVAAIKQMRETIKHAPMMALGAAPGQSKEELTKLAGEMEQKLSEFKLPEEAEAERKKLMNDGFPDWSRKDFKVCLICGLPK